MKITKLIPLQLRRFLLKKYQNFVFNNTVKQIDNLSADKPAANKKILKDLIFGWGNQGWSAQIDYLESCVNHAFKTEGDILECGSGLSTIVIGTIAKRKGLNLYSLENSTEWGRRVQNELDKLNLNNVSLIINPLKSYEDYDWYDTSDLSPSESLGLIICDGPPSMTRGGRFGLLPVMRPYIDSGTVIMVDDTIRQDEKTMIKNWKKIVDFDATYHGQNDPHAVLTIK